MSEPDRKMGVISRQEFEAGKGRWPCVKCGRHEAETCNGMGFRDDCPNGRKRSISKVGDVTIGQYGRIGGTFDDPITDNYHMPRWAIAPEAR